MSNEGDLKNRCLREAYLSIKVGDGDPIHPTEEVWVKKLRAILRSDIHEQPLGCCIEDTHIKVGDGVVHLDTFYEAQLLFSNARWVRMFTQWIISKISCGLSPNEKVLVIGYETYLHPLLVQVSKRNPNIQYCIYEEEKYTQSDNTSPARIRNIDNYLKSITSNEYRNIVFLCGISTTLSTLAKMRQFFMEKIFGDESNDNWTGRTHAEIQSIKADLEKTFQMYSIIQILPKNKEEKETADGSFSFLINGKEKKLKWDTKRKNVILTFDQTNSGEKGFVVEYLIDVFSNWQTAENCKWCFPQQDDLLAERPLIITETSSVIPTQMIGPQKGSRAAKTNNGTSNYLKNDSSWFFERKEKSGEFRCEQFLYYNHIQRGSHHFRYYFRTAALLDFVLNESDLQKKFNAYCAGIQEQMKILDCSDQNGDETINIIVCPMHFSNERFPAEINERVFKNTAHIISFDPRKEYRSNFEVKYSNYAFALNRLTAIISDDLDAHGCQGIRFTYVDDEIITGFSFYQAKSFVTSLMRDCIDRLNTEPQMPKKCEIFSSVITLIDRTSDSTKYNFINDKNKFFSFLHISIPSIRNYGDSCPICKQIKDTEFVLDNTVLNNTAKYWEEKRAYLSVKSLAEVRKIIEKKNNSNQGTYKKLRHRQFTRLYCENRIWEATQGIWDEHGFFDSFIQTIDDSLTDLTIDEQFEFLISYVKAISRPFLYYKENEKKAVFSFLISLLMACQESKNCNPSKLPTPKRLLMRCKSICTKLQTGYANNECSLKNNRQVFYALVCVIVSSMSDIGCNYILRAENIVALCDMIERIYPDMNKFDNVNEPRGDYQSFYTLLINSYKKLVCGTSGDRKSKWADGHGIAEKLEHASWGTGKQRDYCSLFRVLYLENIQFSEPMKNLDEDIRYILNSGDPKRKYQAAIDECIKATRKPSAQGTADGTFYLFNGEVFYSLAKHTSIPPVYHVNELFNVPNKAGESEQNPNLPMDIGRLRDIMDTEGYYQSGDHYWFMFDVSKDYSDQNKAKESEKSKSPQSRSYHDKAVFLRLSFHSENEKEQLDWIRRILIHRKTFMKAINEDLHTGALMSAIQSTAANVILASNKVDSHGQDSDIQKMFQIINRNFDRARNDAAQGTEVNWSEVYKDINVFMNRCISYGATQYTVKEYFSSPNATQHSPFQNRVEILMDSKMNDKDDRIEYLFDEDNSEKEWTRQEYVDEIIRYLKVIQTPEYIQLLMDEIKRKVNKPIPTPSKIYFDSSLNIFEEKIRNIPAALFFLGDEPGNPIYLLAILDIFLHNAIEHSGSTESTVTIGYEQGSGCTRYLTDRKRISLPEQNNYEKSYCITFSNTLDSKHRPDVKTNEVGFTQIFLTKYLSDIVVKLDDYNRFFAIQTESENSRFTARIFCIVGT